MLPKGYSVCIPLRFSALTEWNAKSLLKSLQSAVAGLSHYEVTAYQHIASANLAQRLISTSGGQKHVHSLEDQITVHLQTSNRFLLRNTPLGNVQPPVPTHWDAEEAAENVKSK